MSTSATRTKQSVSFRWDFDLVNRLKALAHQQNRSLSNFTETLLVHAIKSAGKEQSTPNDVTMAAIEDARSGRDLETLDLDNFDDYVKNL